MRSVAKWMIWWLVSVVGAVAGVLLGYLVAVVVYPLFSFVSFFLILLLGLASIFAGIGLAGAARESCYCVTSLRSPSVLSP